MIVYFSGTGNSGYVAKRIAFGIGEKLLFLPETDPLTLELKDNEMFGLVTPVYSWGIPPIVIDFIRKLNEQFVIDLKDKYVWAVLTCGDETGCAPEMLEKSLIKKGMRLKSGWSVIMPNNYVLLPGFDVDNKKTETLKLDNAPGRIDEIIEKIINGISEKDFFHGSWPRLKTNLVYPLFKRWGILKGRWHWTQECIQCGKCAKVCPVGNIAMIGNHPKWNTNCTSCLACYHICPTHAVEYGKATVRKGQYFCKKGRQ